MFRLLKSELGLRPIYHHKPIRAEGHLFITVIAYQLVQVIRTRRRQAGENASWTTLRRILEGQQRITATFRRGDGLTLRVRKATRAESPQHAICDALGVDPEPGGIRKTIVQATPRNAEVVPLARSAPRNWLMQKEFDPTQVKDGLAAADASQGLAVGFVVGTDGNG